MTITHQLARKTMLNAKELSSLFTYFEEDEQLVPGTLVVDIVEKNIDLIVSVDKKNKVARVFSITQPGSLSVSFPFAGGNSVRMKVKFNER